MENINDTFRKYLDGEMTPENHFGFDQRLKNEEDLFEAFKDFILVKKAEESILNERAENSADKILSKLKRKNQEDLQRINNPNKGESAEEEIKSSKSRRLFFISSIASSLLLLIGFFFFQNKEEVSVQSLAQSEYLENDALEKSLIEPLQSLSGESSDNYINTSLSLLKEKKYNEAIKEFSKINADHPEYHRMQLIKGLALLKIGKYKEANDYINNISPTIENVYLKEEAQWIKLLSLLLNDDKNTKAAKALLSKIIAQPNHKYQQTAKRYYDNLN